MYINTLVEVVDNLAAAIPGLVLIANFLFVFLLLSALVYNKY